MKFAGTEHEDTVRLDPSPGAAKKYGRSFPLRADWETVKDQIMLEALRAKFSQNADVKKILLETGEATIVEHTANDSYWSVVQL